MRNIIEKAFGHNEDGCYKVLNVPALSKEAIKDMTSSRCGHEYDCCGCQFVGGVRRSFFGLFSITHIYRNI